MDNVKFSIITVTYNAEHSLEKTVKSVIQQSYPNIEYIVVDGASTDGTVEILKAYNNKITKWISEPDKGVFDAMAKGIQMATGEYIGFLDSGNWYINSHVLKSIAEELRQGTAFLSTSYIHEKNNGWKITYPDSEFQHLYLRFDVFLHSAFVKKEVFTQYGLPSSTYRCSGDHEFVLRLYTKGVPLSTSETVTIYYEDGGISSDPRKIAYKEDREIAVRYGVPPVKTREIYYKRVVLFSVLLFLRKIKLDKLARRILGKGNDINLDILKNRYCDPQRPWFAEE